MADARKPKTANDANHVPFPYNTSAKHFRLVVDRPYQGKYLAAQDCDRFLHIIRRDSRRTVDVERRPLTTFIH